MNKADIYMNEEIEKILSEGYKDVNPRPKYSDGTPAYTLSINHVFRTYNLSDKEFPICTLRPIAWKTAIKEILWIYQKQSNDLGMLNNEFDVHYWNEWESIDIPHTIGQRYGATVNRYNLIDNLIKDIEENPYGRRKVLSLWQESDLKETDGLAPCAFCSIWNVRENYLDMVLIQRSGDLLAASGGGGINEVQYAALLMMIARHTGYRPGVFSHFVANEQIYDRHIKQANELLKRFDNYLSKLSCKNSVRKFNNYLSEYSYKKPQLIINFQKTNFYEFTIDDFEMVDYSPIKPQLQLELGI